MKKTAGEKHIDIPVRTADGPMIRNCNAANLKMLYLAMMDITKKWTGRRMD